MAASYTTYVDKSKKPVTSACYDKQHVCAYLQTFSHYTKQTGVAYIIGFYGHTVILPVISKLIDNSKFSTQ